MDALGVVDPVLLGPGVAALPILYVSPFFERRREATALRRVSEEAPGRTGSFFLGVIAQARDGLERSQAILMLQQT